MVSSALIVSYIFYKYLICKAIVWKPWKTRMYKNMRLFVAIELSSYYAISQIIVKIIVILNTSMGIYWNNSWMLSIVIHY